MNTAYYWDQLTRTQAESVWKAVTILFIPQWLNSVAADQELHIILTPRKRCENKL